MDDVFEDAVAGSTASRAGVIPAVRASSATRRKRATWSGDLRAICTTRGDTQVPFAVLYRIATNASIDRLRRRKTASEDELHAESYAGTGDEPRRIDSLHDLAVLTKGLSEEELTVAVLHHLDGYTQEGIAASLDLSRRTVGKILGRFEEHVKKRAARVGFAPQKAGHG
jgi:DNA-directed RNA polymerase specialized sigma24 family protein